MSYLDSCRATTAGEILNRFSGDREVPFEPYCGAYDVVIRNDHEMRRACKHVRDTEERIREGRYDGELHCWLHSHYHEEDFEQIGGQG